MKYLIALIALCGIVSAQQTPTFVPAGNGGQNITPATRIPFIAALGVTLTGKAMFEASNPGTNGYVPSFSSSGALTWVANGLGKEPALGNPSTNGYVLSSTAAGVRSWVAGGGGGSYTAGSGLTLTGSAFSIGSGQVTNAMLANGAVANLSGTNTGNETGATIRSALGVVNLSGSNTGDQTLPTLASLGAASRREYKTAGFQAVAYGRYHTNGTGIVVSNPSTGAAGDIFDIVIASGTATINGVSYAASRFPIEVICTVAGTWVTPAAQVSDALTLGTPLAVSSGGLGTGTGSPTLAGLTLTGSTGSLTYNTGAAWTYNGSTQQAHRTALGAASSGSNTDITSLTPTSIKLGGSIESKNRALRKREHAV